MRANPRQVSKWISWPGEGETLFVKEWFCEQALNAGQLGVLREGGRPTLKRVWIDPRLTVPLWS